MRTQRKTMMLQYPNFIQLTYNLDIPCPSDMGHSAKSKYVQLAVEEFEDDNDDNKDENENKVKSAPHAKGPTKNGKPAARLTTWKKVDLDNQDLPEHQHFPPDFNEIFLSKSA
ncbi:hypothetical protein KOW79_000156 [Hemibagrus wyckioides]|uniref:Uncharacterized protein n=1 Tax=Hemibagrus wyckioides TaxID=337641 RepID=A0A9D3SYA4_9TELE|nr:hypothetical protein KOW79_000156 [Hemibagrus wyckioides]